MVTSAMLVVLVEVALPRQLKPKRADAKLRLRLDSWCLEGPRQRVHALIDGRFTPDITA